MKRLYRYGAWSAINAVKRRRSAAWPGYTLVPEICGGRPRRFHKSWNCAGSLATGPRSRNSDSPEARASGLVPHPRFGGNSLRGLQASQPFPLVLVINGRESTTPRLHCTHGEEESLGVVGTEVVFDSQRIGGYSPLDFPSSVA